MKKEDFCEAFGDINENYVKEARQPYKAKKPVWVKWHVMAACFVAVLIAGSISVNRQAPAQGDKPQRGGNTVSNDIPAENNVETAVPAEEEGNVLFVNKADNMMNVDMDVQIVPYDGKMSESRWEEIINDFQEFTGMTYKEFVSKLPGIWENSSFYAMMAPDNNSGEQKKEYSLHDYVFVFQTKNGGEATIALCSFEEPLRDCFVECDNPEQSEINGVPLVIYGHEKWYMVQFSYQNVHYDIEASNITLEELENLLSGILKTESKDTDIKGSVSPTINDTSQTVALSGKDTQKIKKLWEEGVWEDGTSDCFNNCVISIGDKTVYYHSDCGTFNDNVREKNLTLNEKRKSEINTLLSRYIELDSVEKPAEDVWGLEITADEITPTGLTLLYTQSGGNPTGELETGSPFSLQKLAAGQWKDVKTAVPEDEIVWTAEAYPIAKDNVTKMEVDWSYLYGELTPGSYRIGKEIMDFRKPGDYDTEIYYAEFEVDYPAAIMVDASVYLLSSEPMPAEVDESAIVGYTKSYTDTFPEKNGETNFNRELDMPYARVEGGIAVLYKNEWYLCLPEE